VVLCYVGETERSLFYFDSFGATEEHVEMVGGKVQAYFDAREAGLTIVNSASLNTRQLQHQDNPQQKDQCGIYYIRAVQIVAEAFRLRGRLAHVGLVDEFTQSFPRQFKAKDYRQRLVGKFDNLLARGVHGAFREGDILVQASKDGV
jgi:hypothetical protein